MKAQPSSARMLPEQTNLSAWRELLAQAAPDASQTLIEQQSQLLPRFAAYYTKLQQLPRRVRRNLQGQLCRAGFNPPASANGSASWPHECGSTASYADLPRRLRRNWKRSAAGLALMLALGQMPALAATITVDGAKCTLVDAITAANTDNAIGLCKAGSGADTLVLRPGSTHTLTSVNNTTDGANGLPVITSPITIAGNGSAITRPSSTPAFRILAVVGPTANLTLRATTISGGVASGTAFAGTGGGVLVVGGTLTVADSAISRNTAVSAGGVLASQQATLVLTNSTVSGNTANEAGGVGTFASTATLTNSTVSGNVATKVGGGVYNAESRVTLTNSTVSGNSGGDRGGGLNIRFGLMTLTNSTVSGNRAAKGGGVFSDGSFGNVKSEVVLNRSLVSGNAAGEGAELFQFSGGTTTAYNSNLFGHSGLTTAQALGGSGSIVTGIFDILATSDGSPVALTAILNPTLANNGGLTRTHALVPGSPAIDNGAIGCSSSTTDQRGVRRTQDGNNDGQALCDIGAFERVRPGTVTCDGLPATKVGTAASETINGTAGVDVIQGLGGNDLIRGLGGNDVVCGGIGNDRLFGGPGEDRLFGEDGTDQLNGELDFDRCDGGPSRDTSANCEQVTNVP